MKARSFILIILVSALGTGCLKTRAQLSTEEAQAQPTTPTNQYAIDEIKNELTQLNGRMADVERGRLEGEPVTREEFEKLDKRIQEIEQTQYQILSTLRKLEKGSLTRNPSSLLDSAKADHRAKRYEEAVEKLGKYLAIPNVSSAAEATYYRGDAYFQLKNYNKAILDFSRFPENHFPKSKFIPKALHKIALSFDAKGMNKDALAFYQELADNHPKTPEGVAAKKQLRRSKKTVKKKKK